MTDLTATVRVPATSANLGPGYDSFGLALTRWDQVSGSLADDFRIEVEGVGAGEVPTDGSHLVAVAAARAFTAAGLTLPGLHLHCTNTIPHGGGQGSSSAAIIAGLLLGRALLPDPAALSDQQIYALATEIEGHPDNVAPALFGRFTLSWMTPEGPGVVVKDVHPQVKAVVFSAAQASSTHYTRSLLPATVPHADAAANAAAAALLVHALTTEPVLLLPATEDRLHQSYRAPAMPDSAALVRDLREAGVAAVISGAGPSVLALSETELDLNRWQRPGFDALRVDVDNDGATVTIG